MQPTYHLKSGTHVSYLGGLELGASIALTKASILVSQQAKQAGSGRSNAVMPNTVKPPKRGQFGTGGFVLSSEVVLSKRSTILYHIFCINVHIQGTTTSKESKDRARD